MSLPVIPKIWTNPQTTVELMRAAGDNLLNIIPLSSLENGYTCFPNRFRSTHVISDPDHLKFILRDNADDFPKAKSMKIILDPVIDQSIFITHGKKWHGQHKNMISVFNWRNIQAFEEPIRTITDNFVGKNIDKFIDKSDLTFPMQDLTFDIIAQILLGTTSNPHFDKLRELFETYLERVVPTRLIDFFTLSFKYFPNIRNFTERKIIEEFQNVGDAIIDERLAEQPPKTPDFLEHLLTAYDCRNAPSSRKKNEVRDNLITFLVAGHETTAMTISWALYAAGYFKEAQDKIRAEHNEPLAKRVYTEAFLHETMRIYPAAPLLVREAAEKTNIGETNVKAREGIILPIIALHRHRKYWDNPDEFMPERFTNGFKPAPYTYLPFGAGPRVCIGMAMAMMEAKIILPAILNAIKINEPTHQPIATQTLTLRSKNGIKIEAELR